LAVAKTLMADSKLRRRMFLAEKIATLALCPANFLDVSSSCSLEGCYVVAVAYKELQGNLGEINRGETESGCKIVGILLFKNELRIDTKRAV
jgi:magnesium-transporting ATPase (P-type)